MTRAPTLHPNPNPDPNPNRKPNRHPDPNPNPNPDPDPNPNPNPNPSPSPSPNQDAADPAAALEGLMGCTAIRTRLAEYQAVVEAAARAGRDPLDDLALTFCFQGSPGTGKTTVARRMGRLFAALGVLPSAEVVQVENSPGSRLDPP